MGSTAGARSGAGSLDGAGASIELTRAVRQLAVQQRCRPNHDARAAYTLHENSVTAASACVVGGTRTAHARPKHTGLWGRGWPLSRETQNLRLPATCVFVGNRLHQIHRQLTTAGPVPVLDAAQSRVAALVRLKTRACGAGALVPLEAANR